NAASSSSSAPPEPSRTASAVRAADSGGVVTVMMVRRAPGHGALSAEGDQRGVLSGVAGSLGRYRRLSSGARVRPTGWPSFPHEGRMERKSNAVFRNVAIGGVILLDSAGLPVFGN